MPRRRIAEGEELWPVHLRPLPDELLSSWIVRLAYAHDLKLRTFVRLAFPVQHEIWYRDIDRLAPLALLKELSAHTGLSLDKVETTTLRAYEGRIYRYYRAFGVQQWILPLMVWEWQHQGYGLQFCPACLAEDPVPYYRKRWRVAFYTWCCRHQLMLHDRCPRCGAPVSFHRRDLNAGSIDQVGAITLCDHCNFDFRETPEQLPVFFETSSKTAFEDALLRLEYRGRRCKPHGVGYYDVLHQLCHLATVRYRNVSLARFAEVAMQVPVNEGLAAKAVFETRDVHERHHIAQLAFWYMADLKERLAAAWNAGAITQSALLRDFEDCPASFRKMTKHFSDWRKRSGYGLELFARKFPPA